MSDIGNYTSLEVESPDPRDFVRKYNGEEIPSIEKHPKADLRKYINHVYNQRRISCCSANVLCAAYGLELKRQAEFMNNSYLHFDPSCLFVYYNSRMYDGTTGENAGVSFCNALKAMNELGVCRESLWPYDRLKLADKPSSACYEDAIGNTIFKYEHIIQNIHQFRACLKEGFSFAFGFELYESFHCQENRKKGMMPIPSDEEIQSTKPILHGVLAVGYDDNTECITVLNSWGKKFGDKGYFYMPYKYISEPKRAFDFWKIAKICKKSTASKLII